MTINENYPRPSANVYVNKNTAIVSIPDMTNSPVGKFSLKEKRVKLKKGGSKASFAPGEKWKVQPSEAQNQVLNE